MFFLGGSCKVWLLDARSNTDNEADVLSVSVSEEQARCRSSNLWNVESFRCENRFLEGGGVT